MTTISPLILHYGILIIQVCSIAAENAKLPSMMETKPFHSNGGMIGVTSVAEITSEDGKVSTNGGVKFYSPVGAKANNEPFMKPWIFSRKTRDGFVMGAVQMYPNTVTTSAVSYGHNNFGPIMNWPVSSNFYPTTFTSPLNRNRFTPNYMFKDFDPFVPDFGFDNAWYRPTRIYDPFVNIWR